MRKSVLSCLFLAVQLIFLAGMLNSQVISRFDFNGATLTSATAGPDAVLIDPDAVQSSGILETTANCNPGKGVDLVIPNAGGILDVPSIGMKFFYQRDEDDAIFFSRGNTRLFMNFGTVFIQYRTTDGGASFLDYGPFNTGYTFATDHVFHELEFTYDEFLGLGEVRVDGGVVWSNDGPDLAPLDWAGAGNLIAGDEMDGDCNGRPFLDYFEMFQPTFFLPVTAIDFTALRHRDGIRLYWNLNQAIQPFSVQIERSENGNGFTPLASLNQNQSINSEWLDPSPGTGPFVYRIKGYDPNANQVWSKEALINAEQISEYINLYPNPGSGIFHIQCDHCGEMTIRISDLQGKELHRKAICPGEILDLSGLPPGYYEWNAMVKDSEEKGKIIISK